jgi:hypothetical protein
MTVLKIRVANLTKLHKLSFKIVVVFCRLIVKINYKGDVNGEISPDIIGNDMFKCMC